MEIEPDSPTFHLVKVAYQVFNKQDIEEEVEKEMGTHSSILAWRIPGTEEPGGLQSMGIQRVRHDRACMHAYVIVRENLKLVKW